MAQREWVEKDFYKELGVSSDASEKRSRGLPEAGLRTASGRATRTTRLPRSDSRRSRRPTASCPMRPSARNTTRPDGCSPAAASAGASTAGAAASAVATSTGSPPAPTAASSTSTTCSVPPGRPVGPTSATSSVACSAAGLQQRPSRPRRGNDLETESELSFLEATKGVEMPLRLTSAAPCTNCHGSGARPGTSPRVCVSCNGSGVISSNQGAFGFCEPCTECRGSGSIIEHPCTECEGTGRAARTRTINVRIPPGVEDGNGSGWPVRERQACAALRPATSTSPYGCARTRSSAATATT